MSYMLHVLLVGVPGAVALLLFNGSLFSYHPILMSLAFLTLMGEGVLFARKAGITTGKDARATLMANHARLQLLALVFSLAGFATIYINKERLGKPHFKTWHGSLGLGVVLASLGVSAGGAAIYYRIIPSVKLTGLAKKAHRALSPVVFLCAAGAVVTGMKPLDAAHPVNRGEVTWGLVAATVSAVLLAAFIPQKSRADSKVE